MSNDPGHDDSGLLLRSGLAFNGRITASVTHELNNVIGTIMQVVGLIEDLAMSDEVKQAGLSDRVLSVVERIERQADRGTALIKRLNTFAHLSDKERAECQLGDLLTTMANLSERLVGLKKATLIRSGLGQEVTVITNPIQFAQVVFGCIDAVLSVSSAGDEIELRLSPIKTGGLIEVVAPGVTDPEQIALGADTRMVAERLGLSINSAAEGGAARIRIAVPSRLEGEAGSS